MKVCMYVRKEGAAFSCKAQRASTEEYTRDQNPRSNLKYLL